MKSLLLAVATGLAAVTPAAAADYPVRPLRVIVPQAPGSTTDMLGRVVLTRMSERLGKPMVVDNRPGAGGTLGMEIAARAAPDGYTLIAVAASMLTIAPHTYKKLGYEPLRDFTPVGLFVLTQTALCVNASMPVKTPRDLIELARAKPGALNMASAGMGTTSHLGGLLFATLAGISANHVPYKGGGPSVASVAQGEAHWTVPPLSAAMPQVKAGRMRCLATGGDRRSAVTPELPTLAESGVTGYRFYGWNGIVAPRGTSRQAVMLLNAAMADVLGAVDTRRVFFDFGEEPTYSTPEAFEKFIRDDYEAMGRLVRLAGVRPE